MFILASRSICCLTYMCQVRAGSSIIKIEGYRALMSMFDSCLRLFKEQH